MLSYLHDIRNKLTVISGHTTRLAKKYNDEEFVSIKTNLIRINDLINEAYEEYTQHKDMMGLTIETGEFLSQVELLVDALTLSFPIEIKNQVAQARLETKASVSVNINLLVQVLENAIDNSIKANSTKIYVRMLEGDRACIVELVDDGSGVSPIQVQAPDYNRDQTSIPHGLGKKIMVENMSKVGGKVEWLPRMDGSGMIVRLYFPLTLVDRPLRS